MYPSLVIVLVALQRSMNETIFNASELPRISRTQQHVSQIVFSRHADHPPGLAPPDLVEDATTLDLSPKEGV